MENLFEKAIEGGYTGFEFKDHFSFSKGNSYVFGWDSIHVNNHGRSLAEILYEPEFWQCLGKALKWKEKNFTIRKPNNLIPPPAGEWLYRWHCFITHTAKGGSQEDFLISLTN